MPKRGTATNSEDQRPKKTSKKSRKKLEPPKSFLDAAYQGDFEYVMGDLQNQQNVNGYDDMTGNTALHQACFGFDLATKFDETHKDRFTNRQMRVIRSLIQFGADPIKPNFEGVLPLDILRENRASGEAVEYLYQKTNQALHALASRY